MTVFIKSWTSLVSSWLAAELWIELTLAAVQPGPRVCGPGDLAGARRGACDCSGRRGKATLTYYVLLFASHQKLLV